MQKKAEKRQKQQEEEELMQYQYDYSDYDDSLSPDEDEDSLSRPESPPTPMSIDSNLRDDDEQEDPYLLRSYLEELNRQIARDEQNNPELAQFEKVMKFSQRFRVNKDRSSFRQMVSLYRGIQDTIMDFTEMVRKRISYHIRQGTVALLTSYVNFRDIVNSLAREKVETKDEFRWQFQFKFEAFGLEDAIRGSGSHNQGVFATEKLRVEFTVFNQSHWYGFEYLGNCPRLVVTPLTERCQRSLLAALQYNYGGAPEGPFGTGKTETTKDLSRQIAKICFVMNCSATYEYTGVCRFFKGLASSGAWVCFDEFNRMEAEMLSMMAQILITLQSALKARAKEVLLNESMVALKADCAIFITLNPGYAGRSELPMNLKSLFRQVSMVVPDSRQITEILLYSAGFIGAQQLAKKVVSVQSLANDIIKKTQIQHDFGLRSIKAIITAAEKLKLQAQMIEDCELSEVMDDFTISGVHYQSETIVQEIMEVSQQKIKTATQGQSIESDEESDRKGAAEDPADDGDMQLQDSQGQGSS